MITKHYKLIKDIINLSFPFLYSIFIFNQFIYHNSNSYKVTFLDFTYFYLFIFVIFLLFYFVFIKKKSVILYNYFLIINLILIFLLISSFYKYFEINLIFKIALDLFVAIILFIYFVYLKKNINILLLFFTLLISVKVLSPLPKIFKHLDNYKYEKDVFSYEYAETNEKFNNVYHIILDGFQGNLFKLIDTNDYFTLNNFIFYENFYSKYRDTIYSNKNTFVGYDHTQEKKNFLQNDGWCSLLQQKKIFIEMYVRRNSNRKKCSDNFSTSKDVYEEFKKKKIKFKNPYFDIEDISTGNIFKIVFFNRLLPSSIFEILENFLSTDENRMFDPNMLKSKNLKKKLTINETDVSIISLMNYIKFYENEVNIKSYNTYKHLHLMLPHAPFLFNKKSLKKIKSRNMPNIESSEYFAEYIDQAYFSLKLVNNFMDILKKQNKFENSMIIIHADHGYDFVNSKNTYQKLNGDDYSDIESKSSSLLLIKYPANFKNIFNKNLNYQNEFVSKLILDNFKIENNIKLDGELIFYINNKEKIKKNPLNGKWEN